MDRGLQYTQTMQAFNQGTVTFIARAKNNRKYVELQSLFDKNQKVDLGELTLLKDSKVHLYTGKPINNKRGKVHYRKELAEVPFRLIVAKCKTENSKEHWFITNDFNLSAKEITPAYRRRWDIGGFLSFYKTRTPCQSSCFIKQKWNGSDIIHNFNCSLNQS